MVSPSRLVGGAAAVVLALTAVPALAADEPAVLSACEAVAGASPLTLAGLTTPFTAPVTPSPSLAAAPLPTTSPDTARTFVLDLAGQPVGTLAVVDAELTWGQFVNDFDLFVTTAEGRVASQLVNPTEMSAREQAGVGGVAHCTVLTVSVRNYLAGPDTLSLALKADVEVPEEL